MSICSHCGHALDNSSFPDQIGIAFQQFSNSQIPVEGAPSHHEIFDALVYLARSRDNNDLLAFYLLHQVFVALSRHDPVEKWPTLEQMWQKAQRKVLAAS
ncbi:MAG: hypothetical protein ACXVZX_10805 [Terriglobales bacterium]